MAADVFANNSQFAVYIENSRGVNSAGPHKIALRKSTVHLLTTVASHVSSTEIRHRLDRHQTIHGLVPARVEEYIRGQALYR